jgi:putative addiction module component (TIGR02574 family)
MESSVLAQLLRLPPGDRAELAMALWESLSDDEREGELALSPEQRAELDRRWATTRSDPTTWSPGPKFAGSCWQESDPTCCFPT